MEKLDENLVSLAYDIVSEGSKEMSFGQGSDYQADLSIEWYEGRFHAELTTSLYSHTIPPTHLQPREIVFKDTDYSYSSRKIKDIHFLIKRVHGFDITQGHSAMFVKGITQ